MGKERITMTKKENEIDLLKYFIPSALHNIIIKKEDIDMYFEWSEQGKHKDNIKLSHFTDGFNALVSAKGRRELQMQIWEDGMEFVPYISLLGGYEKTIIRKWYNPFKYTKGKYKFEHKPIARNVVDFMKKGILKRMDADSIERTYQEINNYAKYYLPVL